MPGNYIISAWLRTNSSSGWRSTNYNVQFILSHNQTTYEDEACGSQDDGGTSNYYTLQNADNITTHNVSSTISDWQLVEIPITLSDPSYNWFSVNLDGNGFAEIGVTSPYFGFDQVYISDEQCYCPLVRNISGQTFSGIQTGGYAQEYLNLQSGNTVVTDGTNPVNVLFTAGNAVTVTPGFNTQAGVVAEIKITSCFSNTPDAEFFIPYPTSLCFNGDGMACFCFYTKNITEYSFRLSDAIGDSYIINATGEINTSVVDVNGYNKTCFPVSAAYVEDEELAYYFIGSGCNSASITSNRYVFINAECDGALATHNQSDSILIVNHSDALKIYPDPFCDEININNQNFSNNDYIMITDMTGRLVNKTEINGINSRINLRNLQSGPYLVIYKGINGTITQKLSKACE